MVSLVTVSYLVYLMILFGSFVICDICENKKVLSRKKRFLTFPEGSSLQLVYDQIIGVVDYTDLWILGVTVAMAWPLPTKPYDENMLREQFLNETEPAVRRNDENITAAAPVVENVDQSYNTIGADLSYNDINSDWYGKYSPWDDIKRKDFAWDRNDSFSLTPKPSSTQKPSSTPKPRKRHLAYTPMGKRSLPTANRIDRFYLNHHRSTRHTLYKTVEKYMNARGKNGTDCVRKALCETRKKQFDQTPMSLVGEIMRAIFSLPPTNEDTKHSSLSREYDEAFNANRDCQEMYPNCKDSLWTADFIF